MDLGDVWEMLAMLNMDKMQWGWCFSWYMMGRVIKCWKVLVNFYLCIRCDFKIYVDRFFLFIKGMEREFQVASVVGFFGGGRLGEGFIFFVKFDLGVEGEIDLEIKIILLF